MKNLKIAQKLALGFGLSILMTIILAALSIFSAISIDKSFIHLLDYPQKRLEALLKANNDFSVARRSLSHMSTFVELDDSQTNINQQLAAVERALDSATAEMNNFISLVQNDAAYTDAEKSARIASANEITRLKERWYNEVVLPLTRANLEGRRQDVIDIYENVSYISYELFDAVDDLYAKTEAFSIEESKRTSDSAERIIIIIIAIALIIVIVSAAFAVIISLGIVRPLSELTGFMRRASSTGDITLRKEDIKLIETYEDVKDEIGQCITSSTVFIKRILEVGRIIEQVAGGDLTAELKPLSDKDVIVLDMGKMTGNLNNMFSEIHSAAKQVSSGSKQIANGAQSLAQGATEQASTIEELSASISDIATKTAQNAEMAKESAGLSGAIKQNAEKGSVQMDQLMDAVQEINDASSSISKVIKAIDDIAFQTNILALNAAVEAARAGQHGKGFAVVAEEVRNLAAKSAEAAKDTGAMIANSIDKANMGHSIAEGTVTSLKEIVDGINRSVDLINRISQSSHEQTEAITMINTGVDQVAQVVHENSATAEESAAASEQLSGQAEMLEMLLNQFKIKAVH